MAAGGKLLSLNKKRRVSLGVYSVFFCWDKFNPLRSLNRYNKQKGSKEPVNFGERSRDGWRTRN